MWNKLNGVLGGDIDIFKFFLLFIISFGEFVFRILDYKW